MASDVEIQALLQLLAQALNTTGRTIVTAESCTGGGLAEALTSVPGSSGWFERGFVVYTNTAKREMLDVKAATLARFGAVSEQTARAMAVGALRHSHGDLAAAITGIAGPDGGTPEKPVGTVCLAWATKELQHATTCHFNGDRQSVRRQSVIGALQGLLEYAK